MAWQFGWLAISMIGVAAPHSELYGDFTWDKPLGVALQVRPQDKQQLLFECVPTQSPDAPVVAQKIQPQVAARLATQEGMTMFSAGYGPQAWEQQWPLDREFLQQMDWSFMRAQLEAVVWPEHAKYCLQPMILQSFFSPLAHLAQQQDEVPMVWQPAPQSIKTAPQKQLHLLDEYQSITLEDWQMWWAAAQHRRDLRYDQVRRGLYFEMGYQFQQELFLYSMPAFHTGAHHTGTITMVYRRSAGSEAWTFYKVFETCNHGSCPHAAEMELYAICSPKVVLSEWYAIDNECQGVWMVDHLCNDDTALQINNAFGRWSENNCQHTRRLFRPSCEPHW